MKKTLIALAIGAAVGGNAQAEAASFDVGFKVQKFLNDFSYKIFGFAKPVGASETVSVPRVNGQTTTDLLKLAKGLKAEIVTRNAGNSSDMLAFWPNDIKPTHVITCIESGNTQIGVYPSGQPKLIPSVQRTDLATGEVSTILRGMIGCDGIRRTPWGTIVATEEVDDGGLYEILNPLTTSELTLVSRGASDVIDSNGAAVAPGQVAFRGALGKLAWEGLDLTKSGVVYYGDEERPGSAGADADGGSIFKYVPDVSKLGNGAAIANLDQSPLVQGSVYAYQASCQARTSSSFPQFGQGCEIGEGAWVKVDTNALRVSANERGATGFYRPEDLHFDINYKGLGAKFCWTDTGNAGAQNYGEVVCITDTLPEGTGEKISKDLTYLADSNQEKGFAVAAANRVLEGDTDLNQPDNLAFQPVTGNMYVIEDNPFGDIWACLADGKDRDIKTDGCVKVLSVRDGSAEPTGFAFTGDGKTAYFYIQHSADAACTSGTDCAVSDDYATDDLIKVTGFNTRPNR